MSTPKQRNATGLEFWENRRAAPEFEPVDLPMRALHRAAGVIGDVDKTSTKHGPLMIRAILSIGYAYDSYSDEGFLKLLETRLDEIEAAIKRGAV